MSATPRDPVPPKEAPPQRKDLPARLAAIHHPKPKNKPLAGVEVEDREKGWSARPLVFGSLFSAPKGRMDVDPFDVAKHRVPKEVRAYNFRDVDPSLRPFFAGPVHHNKFLENAGTGGQVDHETFKLGAVKNYSPRDVDSGLPPFKAPTIHFNKFRRTQSMGPMHDSFFDAANSTITPGRGGVPALPGQGKKVKATSPRVAAPPKAAHQIEVPPKDKCMELFNRLDPNGNGMLSLAELDKGVVELWPKLNNKPAIMRAYKAADVSGEGFVTRKEFMFFLKFLTYYNNLWADFDAIDTSDDRRITKEEFRVAAAKVAKIGKRNPDEVFVEIDVNGGGFILFDEFCSWMAQRDPS